MKKLEGKVAIVTGVSRKKGIGFAVAKALAREGANIFLAYYQPYDTQAHNENDAEVITDIIEVIQKNGVEVRALEIDLAIPESPKQLMDEVIKNFGKADILINNACYSENENLERLTVISLNKHYEVNTRAVILLTSEFYKNFQGSEGWVISMTSGQGVGPMPEEISYASTKGAIDAFTLSASPTLAEKNIKIYSLDPGPVNTGWMSEELKADVVKASARKRITEPGDVAEEILSLISGDDSVQSGQVIRRRYGI